MAGAPLFTFERVGLRLQDRDVLRGISLDIPATGVTGIIGASGAGKSTLLRLGNRLEVPTAGRILFRGSDVAGLDPLALRRQVGMIFQRPSLFPGSVRDNLLVADPGLDTARAVGLLERADLDAGFLDREAATLSGGEGQRACVARCLATAPEALLADEPTSALDVSARLALERLAGQLARDGVPVVWVSHDLDQVRRIADRVIVLEGGAVRAAGPRDEVLDPIEGELRAVLAAEEADRGK